MHFRDHILLYVLVPAILLLGLASYYRFIVSHDYIAAYEGECDPATESCFVGCEDDECAEEYYYSLMEKRAADLYKQCGPDITDCESAYVCLPDDRECSITYCDPETDGDVCSTLTEEENTDSIDSEQLLEESSEPADENEELPTDEEAEDTEL